MENRRPLISVIVPVYNVKPYLPKCLDSICGQTYANLEIIIVDDGSTDGSGAICDEYARQDSRVKVLHCENGGSSVARNSGLDVVAGEYVGFVDSDDWIDEDMYSTLFGLVKEHGSDIAVCSYIKESGAHRSKKQKETVIFFDAKQAMAELISDRKFKNFCCNKLFSRDVFDDLRFPVGRYYEDIALMYKAFAKVKRVAYTTRPLYHYLIRKDSITGDERHQLDKHKWIVRAFTERSSFLMEYDMGLHFKSLTKTVHVLVRFVNYLLRVRLLDDKHKEFMAFCQEELKKIPLYRIRPDLGVKAYLVVNHLSLYGAFYRFFRSVFKSK